MPPNDEGPREMEFKIENVELHREGEDKLMGCFMITAVPDENFPHFEYSEEALEKLVLRTPTGYIPFTNQDRYFRIRAREGARYRCSNPTRLDMLAFAYAMARGWAIVWVSDTPPSFGEVRDAHTLHFESEASSSSCPTLR